MSFLMVLRLKAVPTFELIRVNSVVESYVLFPVNNTSVILGFSTALNCTVAEFPFGMIFPVTDLNTPMFSKFLIFRSSLNELMVSPTLMLSS